MVIRPISRENNQRLECFIQGWICLSNEFTKRWSIQEKWVCTICIAAMFLKDETPYGVVESIEECIKLKDMFRFRISKVTLLIRKIDFIQKFVQELLLTCWHDFWKLTIDIENSGKKH